MKKSVIGKINSIQTLGTVDGPGVRFVVFTQGCNLRCGCCHNPDTWDISQGDEYSALSLAEKAEHYREYFGSDGGVTLSGGEPLLQTEFATEFFKECKKRNISTCLDTSGSIMNEKVKELLQFTDLVLLDIKYTNDEDYKNYVGCSMSLPLKFLEYLNEQNIPVVLRQVIIPTLNDNDQNMLELASLAKKYPNIIKTELLGFKKLCQTKYDKLGIDFPFKDLPTPTNKDMERLYKKYNSMIEI